MDDEQPSVRMPEPLLGRMANRRSERQKKAVDKGGKGGSGGKGVSSLEAKKASGKGKAKRRSFEIGDTESVLGTDDMFSQIGEAKRLKNTGFDGLSSSLSAAMRKRMRRVAC